MRILILSLIVLIPCIYGQGGFQSGSTAFLPPWGQFDGQPELRRQFQEQLVQRLISRGWAPPRDVQRELALGRPNEGGFGNRFDFGFTPDQLVPPGVSVGDLLPTDLIRDPSASNSLASLPGNIPIPDGLTRGLVDTGLLNPALVNPNFGGAFIDPTLPQPGLIDPAVGGPVPALVDVLPGGGPIVPVGPGLVGPHKDGDHGVGVVKNALAGNKLERKHLKQELRARKQLKKEKRRLKKAMKRGDKLVKVKKGIRKGRRRGDIDIYPEKKVVKVVAPPPPPPRRENPVRKLAQGILLGGLGALLLGK